LIEKGADVTAADIDGRTALHVAARYGCEKVVEMLLAAGADVTAIDNSGRTALQLAAQGTGINMNMNIVFLLHNVAESESSELKVIPDSIDDVENFKELMEKRREAQARLLLDQKVRDNACDLEGVTPVLIGLFTRELDRLLQVPYE
jgi:hypothetical protein